MSSVTIKNRVEVEYEYRERVCVEKRASDDIIDQRKRKRKDAGLCSAAFWKQSTVSPTVVLPYYR